MSTTINGPQPGGIASSREAVQAHLRAAGALALVAPPPPRAAISGSAQVSTVDVGAGTNGIPPIPASMSPGEAWATFTRGALHSADSKLDALRTKRQAVDAEIADVQAERAAIAAAFAVWERRRGSGGSTTNVSGSRSKGARLGRGVRPDSIRHRVKVWSAGSDEVITIECALVGIGEDVTDRASRYSVTAALKGLCRAGQLVRVARGVYRRAAAMAGGTVPS